MSGGLNNYTHPVIKRFAENLSGVFPIPCCGHFASRNNKGNGTQNCFSIVTPVINRNNTSLRPGVSILCPGSALSSHHWMDASNLATSFLKERNLPTSFLKENNLPTLFLKERNLATSFLKERNLPTSFLKERNLFKKNMGIFSFLL